MDSLRQSLIARGRAQADIFLEGPDLKTAGQLRIHDKNAKSCSDLSKIDNLADEISSDELMVKIAVANKTTNGLTEAEQNKLWQTMPYWVPVSFLKKTKKYFYIFNVDQICDKKIPVTVTLIKNTNYDKQDPYKFLDALQRDYKKKMGLTND